MVGYPKCDPDVPRRAQGDRPHRREPGGRLWCDEVNSAIRSDLVADPAERLVSERAAGTVAVAARPDWQARDPQGGPAEVRPVRIDPLLGPGQFTSENSSRSVSPAVFAVVMLDVIIAEYQVVAPGAASANDHHYDGQRPASGRAVRPNTAAGTRSARLVWSPLWPTRPERA